MATQIEFLPLVTGYRFPANSGVGAITASLTGLTPDLLHRRIFADIRQNGATTRVVTFTLNFKIGGVSVGTVTQRPSAKGDGEGYISNLFYALGPTMNDGVLSYSPHTLPGSMLFATNGAGEGFYIREVLPLDLTLMIDEILVTCSEYNSSIRSGTAVQDDICILLACLSSAHRF